MILVEYGRICTEKELKKKNEVKHNPSFIKFLKTIEERVKKETEEKAMEFEVGDNVVIELPGTFCHGFKGGISKVLSDNQYVVGFNNGHIPAIICGKDLKPITPKPFTKSDLKDGMIVTNREGTEYTVLYGELHRRNGWDNLEHFKHDLTHDNIKEYDIMQVKQGYMVVFDRVEKQEHNICYNNWSYVEIEKELRELFEGKSFKKFEVKIVSEEVK